MPQKRNPCPLEYKLWIIIIKIIAKLLRIAIFTSDNDLIYKKTF